MYTVQKYIPYVHTELEAAQLLAKQATNITEEIKQGMTSKQILERLQDLNSQIREYLQTRQGRLQP